MFRRGSRGSRFFLLPVLFVFFLLARRLRGSRGSRLDSCRCLLPFVPRQSLFLPSFLLISRVGPRDFELDAVECRVLLPGLQQCTLLPHADHVGDVQRASHARGDPSCRVLVCFSTHDGHRNVFKGKTSVLTSPSRTLAFPRNSASMEILSSACCSDGTQCSHGRIHWFGGVSLDDLAIWMNSSLVELIRRFRALCGVLRTFMDWRCQSRMD